MSWSRLRVCAVVGLGSLIAAGCNGSRAEAPGSGGESASGSPPAAGGSPSSGGALSLGGLGTNASGSGGAMAIAPEQACATGTVSASLSGANLLVMFDRSASMTALATADMLTRWQVTTAALIKFFGSREAAGLGVALRFFPHDLPTPGCGAFGCDAEACAEPLVPLGVLQADPMPADAQEQALISATQQTMPGDAADGTPIFTALKGAYMWGSAQRARDPSQNAAVLLVTDGEPQGCQTKLDPITQLAADAFSTNGIRTFAVGLTGSSQVDIDRIAAAGGTERSIFVNDGTDTQGALLAALSAIRGQLLDCDFPSPPPKAGREVDPTLVNVNYTPGGGMKSTLPQVSNRDACGANGGWYYDDPSAPQRITLCKTTCDTVTADRQAAIDILLGCATVVDVPK